MDTKTAEVGEWIELSKMLTLLYQEAYFRGTKNKAPIDDRRDQDAIAISAHKDALNYAVKSRNDLIRERNVLRALLREHGRCRHCSDPNVQAVKSMFCPNTKCSVCGDIGYPPAVALALGLKGEK